MTTLAIVGCGYWGKNLIRNFSQIATVKTCCHRGDATNREWVLEHYPEIEVTTDISSVLHDEAINAVVVATPIGTHADLTERALRAGKDVFVEKPLADTVSKARHVASVAEEVDQTLFVGYVFIHHPLIRELGVVAGDTPVETFNFSWEKCGRFDTDIRLDIVSHPVSVAYHLSGHHPPASVRTLETVTAVSSTDIISASLEIGDLSCNISVNRVAPEAHKSLFVQFADGRKYFFDDERLLAFDADEQTYEVHRRRETEPLRAECEHFIASLEEGHAPVTDGEFGRAINEIVSEL